MDVQKLYTAFVMREKINEASDGSLYADYKMHRFIRYVKKYKQDTVRRFEVGYIQFNIAIILIKILVSFYYSIRNIQTQMINNIFSLIYTV